MYYGIVAVTAVAFSCATEFVPEINEQLKLVPFPWDFKVALVGSMIADYCGCWVIEKVLKLTFSDYKPKDIAVRRPDQLDRERVRFEKEEAERIRELEIKLGKA